MIILSHGDYCMYFNRQLTPKSRSAASIKPMITNVYTTDDTHVISCLFDDTLEEVTGVTWSPATQTPGKYSLADGTYDIRGRRQISTLTISQAELVELKASGRTHSFTCKITVAKMDITATQTIHLFTPSKTF